MSWGATGSDALASLSAIIGLIPTTTSATELCSSAANTSPHICGEEYAFGRISALASQQNSAPAERWDKGAKLAAYMRACKALAKASRQPESVLDAGAIALGRHTTATACTPRELGYVAAVLVKHSVMSPICHGLGVQRHFGQHCLSIARKAILRLQDRGFQEIIKESQAGSSCGADYFSVITLIWQWDETQQRSKTSSAAISGELTTGIRDSQIMVQHGAIHSFRRLASSSECRYQKEEWFCDVLQLGSTKSPVLLKGLAKIMPHPFNVALKPHSSHLADLGHVVCLGLECDDATSNVAVRNFILAGISEQPDTVLGFFHKCGIHQIHRTNTAMISNARVAANMYCIAKLMQMSSCISSFVDSLKQYIEQTLVYDTITVNCRSEAARNKQLIAGLCRYGDPFAWRYNKRTSTWRPSIWHQDLLDLMDMIDLSHSSLRHLCRQEDDSLCCDGQEDAVTKLTHRALRCFAARKLRVPMLSRWTNVRQTALQLFIGRACHNMFGAAAVNAWSGEVGFYHHGLAGACDGIGEEDFHKVQQGRKLET